MFGNITKYELTNVHMSVYICKESDYITETEYICFILINF